ADILRAGLREQAIFSEPAAPPSLTVAICTKDRAWSVARCLDSLLPLQQVAAGERPAFEILVVDNPPSDSSTRALVAALASVRYASEPKPGLDFARNMAVREAFGDYLSFLDDDVIVDRSWFDGLRRAISENPEAGAITGPVLPMELETHAQILFEERGGFHRG